LYTYLRLRYNPDAGDLPTFPKHFLRHSVGENTLSPALWGLNSPTPPNSEVDTQLPSLPLRTQTRSPLDSSNAKRFLALTVNPFWRGFGGKAMWVDTLPGHTALESRPLKRGVWGAATQAQSLYSNRSTQSKTLCTQ